MALDKQDLIFFGILAAVLAVFFYKILGISGVLPIFAIILIFIVPAYVILGNFDLGRDEKLVFAFFISTGIFPIFSFWLGTIISFKLAIIITFALLVATGIFIRRFKKNKQAQANKE